MMRRVSHDSEVPLTGYQTEYDNLHLCFACVYAGGRVERSSTWHKGRNYNDMKSFRVVAACALLSELTTLESGRGGGGYVGVRGDSTAAPRHYTRAYAAVPPPSGGL